MAKQRRERVDGSDSSRGTTVVDEVDSVQPEDSPPRIGDIVHLVPKAFAGAAPGVHLAAMVTKIEPDGSLGLHAFLPLSAMPIYYSHVTRDEVEKKPFTYHMIERD